MRLKFIRRDRGSFSGDLLPFLPVCCRDRAERVLAVRVMRRYGKCLSCSLLEHEAKKVKTYLLNSPYHYVN